MPREIEVDDVIFLAKTMCEDPDSALGGANGATYIDFIDGEYARLYALYVKAEPDRYRKEEVITIQALPSNWVSNMPNDWLATIGVDYQSSPTVRQPLMRLQEQDRNRYNEGSAGQALAYRILGIQIHLFPNVLLPVGQKYVHVYLPTPPRISSLGTLIDCRLGHEKYLAMRLAKTMLNIENTYDGRWDPEIAAMEAELSMEANYRYFMDDARMTSEYDMRRRSWPNWPHYGWRR